MTSPILLLFSLFFTPDFLLQKKPSLPQKLLGFESGILSHSCSAYFSVLLYFAPQRQGHLGCNTATTYHH